MKKLYDSWYGILSPKGAGGADNFKAYSRTIDCYGDPDYDQYFEGTAFQRKDNNQWEFIPVGAEVWTDGEEIVTITK